MKLRNISGSGQFTIYVVLLLTVLFYFATPLWWMMMRGLCSTIFKPGTAYTAFGVVWVLWLGLPFVLFCGGIYWIRRTRDEGTFCALIGYLIPTACYCAYGAYLLLNIAFPL